MDEILASIRKILNEDEAKAAVPTASAPTLPGDVLLLDEAMIVSPGVAAQAGPAAIPLPAPAALPAPGSPAAPAALDGAEGGTAPGLLPLPQHGPAPQIVDPPQPPYAPVHVPPPGADGPSLVGPAAAGAAGASVEALIRTLARERSTATHRGGPTIEDLVRDEMRPLLRDWLDNHLPPLVERLVRAEIERVVNRTGL